MKPGSRARRGVHIGGRHQLDPGRLLGTVGIHCHFTTDFSGELVLTTANQLGELSQVINEEPPAEPQARRAAAAAVTAPLKPLVAVES